MLKKIGRIIAEMFADDFDDRERLVGCPDFVDLENIEWYDEDMGFGCYKVFQPLSFQSKALIMAHLSDGGVAIVCYNLMESPKEKIKLSDWLKGVACAKQMVYTTLSDGISVIGYCADDRAELERNWGRHDREQMD